LYFPRGGKEKNGKEGTESKRKRGLFAVNNSFGMILPHKTKLNPFLHLFVRMIGAVHGYMGTFQIKKVNSAAPGRSV
jgi:hypothetical protein